MREFVSVGTKVKIDSCSESRVDVHVRSDAIELRSQAVVIRKGRWTAQNWTEARQSAFEFGE